MLSKLARRSRLPPGNYSWSSAWALQARWAHLLGIDVGSSSVCTALVEDSGDVRVIENEQGERVTPCVVGYTDTQKLVGRSAQRQQGTNPANTFLDVRRLLGRPFAEIPPALLENLPYEVAAGLDGEAVFVQSDGTQRSAVELMSEIFRNAKEQAEGLLGETIEFAVVTVPAFYGERRRQALVEAAELAGFKVQETMEEPIAACQAYSLTPAAAVELEEESSSSEGPDAAADAAAGPDKRVVVVDVGGSTSCISVVEAVEGNWTVKHTEVNEELGGRHFDELLLDHVINDFKRSQKIDLRADKMAELRVLEAVVNAKRELSARADADINLPFIAADASGPKHINMTLTVAQLERVVNKLLIRTRKLIEKCLANAGVDAAGVEHVILSGGMCQAPMIQNSVAKIFGEAAVLSSINADEVLAAGSAIVGGMQAEEAEAEKQSRFDTAPISLGVEVLGGVYQPVLRRGAALPTQVKQTFGSAVDDQGEFTIQVYAGERTMVADNELLGEYTVENLPEHQRGSLPIDVFFTLRGSGELEIKATFGQGDSKQNSFAKMELAGEPEHYKEMRQVAVEQAEGDVRMRRVALATARAEQLCWALERLVEHNEEMPDADKVEACNVLDQAWTMIDRQQLDALSDAQQTLSKYAERLQKEQEKRRIDKKQAKRRDKAKKAAEKGKRMSEFMDGGSAHQGGQSEKKDEG